MSRLLEVEDLKVVLKNGTREQLLVQGISFSAEAGECLGILGESGSGKSMAVKAILGLLDKNFHVTGKAKLGETNLIGESEERLRQLRGSRIAMVLQNPMTCFDPLYRLGSQIAETFSTHTDWSAEQIRRESLMVLERMKIREGEEVLQKYPHQLSGGMLQRIMIGIALALKPELLIADEPTTAIDSITQYEILEEFRRIKEMHQTSLIFISHDLSAISRVADRIIVMNHGKIVDAGSFDHILHHSSDPYTRLLVEKRTAVMKHYRELVHKKGGSLCLS